MRNTTTTHADDSMKLLDNGWRIELFANQLGSYTARAARPKSYDGCDPETSPTIHEVVDSADVTPSKALYRLTKAVTEQRTENS